MSPGKIVSAQIRLNSVSRTVVTPKSFSTGKLTNINVENPKITVKPEAVIACPTLESDTFIASLAFKPFASSSRKRSIIRIVNSVPIPNTKQLRAIVNGLYDIFNNNKVPGENPRTNAIGTNGYNALVSESLPYSFQFS